MNRKIRRAAISYFYGTKVIAKVRWAVARHISRKMTRAMIWGNSDPRLCSPEAKIAMVSWSHIDDPNNFSVDETP